MVFKIRSRAKEKALRSIENTKPTKSTKAIVGTDATTHNFVKRALNSAQPKAKSTIRGIFKRSNKNNNKKRNGKISSILGLMRDDPVVIRAETSHETGSSASSMIDQNVKTILSSSRPPMPPSSVQHIRYRNEYSRAPDEASPRGSVVNDGDSIYKLMIQELKQDFSSSKHAPLRFVPAQTVIHSNKTREGRDYENDIDDTLRILDEELMESREPSPTKHRRRPLPDIPGIREAPDTAEEGSDSHDDKIHTIGPLRHASEEERRDFDAQLDCASVDPQEGSSERSVGGRSSRSARSTISARSGRSVRSDRSGDDPSVRDSELVSLRELRGKQQQRRHRKQKSESSTVNSGYSDDSTERSRREQSSRKRSKRDRKRNRGPVDNRSYYSEATGTFDDTTLGDTEYEWDNIDSFDSWLSLEHELRAGANDDWFCGACFR